MFGVGHVRCNRHIIMRYLSNGIVINIIVQKLRALKLELLNGLRS